MSDKNEDLNVLDVDAESSVDKGPITLDPKGRVVLKQVGDDALVFLGAHSPTPYVVAHGYDAKTGEWGYGTYTSDLAYAADMINPLVFEKTVVKWSRLDFEAALGNVGIEPTKSNIFSVLNELDDMEIWKDQAIERGFDMIEDAISSIINTSTNNVFEHKSEMATLKKSDVRQNEDKKTPLQAITEAKSDMSPTENRQTMTLKH